MEGRLWRLWLPVETGVEGEREEDRGEEEEEGERWCL